MNRNRIIKKAAAVGLTIALAAGQTVTAMPVNALAAQSSQKLNQSSSKSALKNEVTKQESVFVNLDALGGVSDITVSDWLKNVTADNILKDYTELTDIKNIKGDETFKQAGSSLTWDLAGQDIYYQGKLEKELPVAITITYELDGKETAPEELAGKSGKLKMNVSYKSTVKSGEVYVPFAMLTGVILPVEHFANVEVEHGKLMSDADRTIVVGMGLPGLKDSLNLSEELEEKAEIPEGFTITADVTDFEMGTTYTIATSELFRDLDQDMDESLNSLKDSMQELKDSSRKLTDGTADLDDGVKELKDKSGEFTDGIGTLNNGLKELETGADSLSEGIKSYTDGTRTLADGITKLKKAVGQLPKKLSALVKGADTAREGADALVENTEKLTAGMAAVDAGIDTVHDTLSQIQDGMSGVTQAVAQSAAAMNKSIEADQALYQTLESTLEVLPEEQKKAVQEQMKVIQTNIVVQSEIIKQMEESDTGKQLKAASQGMDALVKATGKGGELKSGSSAVNTGLSKLQEGQKQLQGGLTQIASGINTLAGDSSMADSLSGAVSQLDEGAKKLTQNSQALITGAGTLAAGASKLEEGGSKLNSGADALSVGVSKLSDGSGELKEGMDRFEKEGIQKLYDMVYEDLDTLLDRLDDISKASADYTSFAGIAEGMEGNVRFILETAEIK